MDEVEYERRMESLNRRLGAIHEMVNRLADREAQAAWVGGYGANGEFIAEKDRLLDNADLILDKMEALLGMRAESDSEPVR